MSILGYETSWFDPVASLSKKLFFKFFLDDNTIEILDEKAAFLKRIFYPDVSLNDLYVGNTITIFSRVLVITSYANVATARYMGSREVHFITIVKLGESNKLGRLLDVLASHKLNIGKIRTTSRPFSNFGINVPIESILVETVALTGVDIESFTNDCSKLLNLSLTMALSTVKITELMSQCVPIQIPDYCTLCLIKPHVLKAQAGGDALNAIIERGFNISGLMSVHFTPDIAHELMDVYSTVYPSYSLMLEQLCVAPLLAVMVTGSRDVVADFREFTGPLSPELARALRPHSLRAVFGTSSVVLNGVHSTDLSDDGEMECRYVFETLASLSL